MNNDAKSQAVHLSRLLLSRVKGDFDSYDRIMDEIGNDALHLAGMIEASTKMQAVGYADTYGKTGATARLDQVLAGWVAKPQTRGM
jgi:hypothetical protein